MPTINRMNARKLKTGWRWLLAVGLMLTSCSDVWDAHYAADPAISGKTLMDAIREDSTLTTFAYMLKATGADTAYLQSSQAFTVWAPVDSAFTNFVLTDTSAMRTVVKNHIARYSIPTASVTDKRIYMLNGKFIRFNQVGTDFAFGGETLLGNEAVAQNGILHKLPHIIPFSSNIWEYMNTGTELDSIKKFLYSFDVNTFDEKNSVKLGVDQKGKSIYDSAFIYSNVQLNRLGLLSTEDSLYTVILPTNTAWKEAYARIRPFYKSFATIVKQRDSIQSTHARLALTRDLVFRGVMEPGSISSLESDSIFSTTGNDFNAPNRLFAGATSKSVSNGMVYTTNQLYFNAWESWQKPIVLEAENSVDRDAYLCNVYTRTTYDSWLKNISGQKYLLVSPTTSSAKPQITFSIPGTLSAKYNVYCVFVPGNVADTTIKNETTKVYFDLTYLNASGVSTIMRTIKPTIRITNPTTITKMFVTTITLPFANYNETSTTVKLKVYSDVLTNETTTYNRRMRIDCVVLEPVH